MDKIFIKGLKVDAIVGIYPHERIAPQPVIIDLDLFIDISKAAKSELITDTIDYDKVSKRIREITESSRFKLLEAMIEYIAEVIFQEFNVSKLRCTISKPQALKNAEAAGITIEREAK